MRMSYKAAAFKSTVQWLLLAAFALLPAMGHAAPENWTATVNAGVASGNWVTAANPPPLVRTASCRRSPSRQFRARSTRAQEKNVRQAKKPLDSVSKVIYTDRTQRGRSHITHTDNMQHEPLTTGQAAKPDPQQDRSGHAVPKNIAQLLYVVRILLEYGRHLAATLESRATRPGFSLIARPFGTANVPVILAHLTRGIMRAIALQSLLLKRAATGRDLEIKPPRLRSPRTTAQVEESIAQQSDQIIAERAEHDAPIDPGRLPTMQQIEAEVRSRPLGRALDQRFHVQRIFAGFCGVYFRHCHVLFSDCEHGKEKSADGHHDGQFEGDWSRHARGRRG